MDDVQSALQALGDPTRLAVFECIRCCGGRSAYDVQTGTCDGGEEGAVSACTIRCHVPCAPSTLTHHFNVLRDAGLIETERKGRKVYARVNEARTRQLASFFARPIK